MKTAARFAGSFAVVVVLSSCAGTPNPATSTPHGSGYLLYAGVGQGAIQVVDARSGAMLRRLPFGTPAPDWSRLYVVSQELGRTAVKAIDPHSGETLGQRAIEGGFTLPSANVRGDGGGLSPDGHWLVVQRKVGSGAQRQSDFMVFNTSLSEAPHPVRLDGDFSFDAVDNQANRIFLIESLNAAEPGHYRVRLYDLRAGALDPRIVVDKREANSASMSGTRISGVFAPDGSYQYSLYVKQGKGAFIHALPLTSGTPFAWCIDLPGTHVDLQTQRMWSLAITPGGGMLYVVNPVLGLVAEVPIDGNGPANEVSTPVSFPPAGSPPSILGSAIVSKDAATVFVAAGEGLLAIDAHRLGVRDRVLPGMPVRDLLASSDGAWLFLSRGSPARIVRWNPLTGVAKDVVSSAADWTLYRAEPQT